MSIQVSAPHGRLFSRFVGRVAGFPVSSLESLRASETLLVHGALRELDRELAGLQETISPALHAAVQGLEDRKLRRNLLQLKRDVHNLRPPRVGKVETVEGHLVREAWEELWRYRELHERRRTLMVERHDTLEWELVELRRRFQDLVGDEGFQNGLLLSSRTLAGELPRYVRASAQRPGSKARQVERSLMRYFSRAAMKATPFSTFCALVPGTFVDGDEGPVGFLGDPLSQHGRIRINKAIYARVLDHLLRRPRVRRRFHVELNPTLDEDGKRWLFLSAVGGREVFQRLAPNPVLVYLRERLSQAPLRLTELIGELMSHSEIEAEEEEAVGYLDRLVEIGLLRFRIGIREQEVDWDRPLAEILAAVDDEHAAAVRAFLVGLRAGVDGYADACPERRREILDSTTAELKVLEQQLGAELGLAGKPIFYEDAGGRAEIRLDPDDLAEILVEYVGLGRRIAWPRNEQADMRHFFDTHYGPEHGPVPLLSFYEDYYREHFKAHLERQQGGGVRANGAANDGAAEDGTTEEKGQDYDLANPFGLEIIDAIAGANRSLSERIRELWRADPSAEEIRLEREDLEAAFGDVPEAGPACCSASLFAQWVPGFGPDATPALVANISINGYGKYFSRFLHVLPDDVRRDLIANNTHLTDRELAEICGDAAFNANLHPPLLPREISYPTGESGSAEEQIPSSRVAVERDLLDPYRLRLLLPATGEEVIPVDLGFLNPRMRPPLYQLLSRFTPPAYFHLKIPDAPEEASHSTERERHYRPRVTYRGRLILARRRWQISLEAFPRKGKKESDAGYFLRVLDWREDLGLPDEVFLRVQPLPALPKPESMAGDTEGQEKDTGDPKKEAKKPVPAPRLRAHLYKPQYVDFRSPLLVDLFSRSAENLERATFTFEERLPRGDQLLTSGEERCVTELVVQIDFPQSAASRETENA